MMRLAGDGKKCFRQSGSGRSGAAENDSVRMYERKESVLS